MVIMHVLLHQVVGPHLRESPVRSVSCGNFRQAVGQRPSSARAPTDIDSASTQGQLRVDAQLTRLRPPICLVSVPGRSQVRRIGTRRRCWIGPNSIRGRPHRSCIDAGRHFPPDLRLIAGGRWIYPSRPRVDHDSTSERRMSVCHRSKGDAGSTVDGFRTDQTRPPHSAEIRTSRSRN